MALDSSAADGFDIGDTVKVLPVSSSLTVVGLAERIGYQASATMFTTYGTYEQAVTAATPTRRACCPRCSDSPGGRRECRTAGTTGQRRRPRRRRPARAEAAAETPGVAQVRQSFQLIFLLYGLVIPLVTGLFLPDHHLAEGQLADVVAGGRRPGRCLVRSLLGAGLIVMVAGIGIGIALYTPLAKPAARWHPPQLPDRCRGLLVGDPAGAGCGQLVFSAAGCCRIDPLEATTGAGVGR